MSIIVTYEMGSGVAPRIVRIVTTDLLATVTSAGWLNNSVSEGLSILPTDSILVAYAQGTSSPVTDYFTPSFSNGIITLGLDEIGVILPVVSGNIAAFSGTGGDVADGLLAANKLLTSALVTPDVSIDLVSFDVTVPVASLASGASVVLVTSSGAKKYKIRQLQLNSGGTNFSGNSGDRLGQVTDATTVYSVIPAATMQALVNAQWGVTALPNPASAAINTSTAAGASLVFKYSAGSADYTAGSLVISGIVQRVV